MLKRRHVSVMEKPYPYSFSIPFILLVRIFVVKVFKPVLFLFLLPCDILQSILFPKERNGSLYDRTNEQIDNNRHIIKNYVHY